jgi:predicted transcriptional regulator
VHTIEIIPNQAKQTNSKPNITKQYFLITKGIDIMANEKKLTKREKFEMIAKIEEVAKNPMLAEFVEHELELLAKKNSSDRGLTSTQKENEGIKSAIVEEFIAQPNRIFTITEMQKNFPCCAELSNQKISALLKQLVEENKVAKTIDKRKSYFSLAK